MGLEAATGMGLALGFLSPYQFFGFLSGFWFRVSFIWLFACCLF